VTSATNDPGEAHPLRTVDMAQNPPQVRIPVRTVVSPIKFAIPSPKDRIECKAFPVRTKYPAEFEGIVTCQSQCRWFRRTFCRFLASGTSFRLELHVKQRCSGRWLVARPCVCTEKHPNRPFPALAENLPLKTHPPVRQQRF
jgi:hypothetical protein